MNIFKTNKFFRVIKHFLLAIPLMVVLGSSLYAIVNPNAKDSYYGETINEEKLIEVDFDKFLPYETYIYTVNPFGYVSGLTNKNIYAQNIYNNGVLTEATEVRFYTSTTNNYIQLYNGAQYVSAINLNTTFAYIQFDFLSVNNFTLSDELNTFYQLEYNQYSYLSNAFEYGLYKFTELGFGNVDFVGIFNGIFTTDINNVYLNFINDYINYYLMVECVYFAPWVLHAFIHFAYSLGDYFMNSFKHNKEDD